MKTNQSSDLKSQKNEVELSNGDIVSIDESGDGYIIYVNGTEVYTKDYRQIEFDFSL